MSRVYFRDADCWKFTGLPLDDPLVGGEHPFPHPPNLPLERLFQALDKGGHVLGSSRHDRVGQHAIRHARDVASGREDDSELEPDTSPRISEHRTAGVRAILNGCVHPPLPLYRGSERSPLTNRQGPVSAVRTYSLMCVRIVLKSFTWTPPSQLSHQVHSDSNWLCGSQRLTESPEPTTTCCWVQEAASGAWVEMAEHLNRRQLSPKS